MEGFTSTPSATMKPNTTTMKPNTATKPSATMKPSGTEGFDMTGKESAIKRGKSSNQIPVAKTTGIENFEPYSGYSQSYSSF